jgi:hypothetical protein
VCGVCVCVNAKCAFSCVQVEGRVNVNANKQEWNGRMRMSGGDGSRGMRGQEWREDTTFKGWVGPFYSRQ